MDDLGKQISQHNVFMYRFLIIIFKIILLIFLDFKSLKDIPLTPIIFEVSILVHCKNIV
jgi:hypothetical protein